MEIIKQKCVVVDGFSFMTVFLNNILIFLFISIYICGIMWYYVVLCGIMWY